MAAAVVAAVAVAAVVVAAVVVAAVVAVAVAVVAIMFSCCSCLLLYHLCFPVAVACHVR